MAEVTTRIRGFVRRTIPQRGFGFIISEDGKEVFFHHKDLRTVLSTTEENLRKIPLPAVGAQVEFVLAPARGNRGTGFCALDVTEV